MNQVGSEQNPDSALGRPPAVMTIAVLVLACPICANAQEGDDAEYEAMEEIVVTGTRIKRRNLISTSPITQVDTDEFLFQGTTRVEDLLNDLPQTVADQAAATNNGASGTATVDLRGLEAVRTLALLNGRRLPAGTPLLPAPDINQIPGMLIERVEVLTGGASATYGSDAISGVVNFITIDDFEGVQLDYQFSQYTHENDSPLARLVEDAGYELPPDNVNDGDTHNLSLTLGLNSQDGKGNLTGYASYREVAAVTQAQRDYSACAVSLDGSFCSGSSTIPDGRFTDFGFLSSPPCVMVPSPTPEDPDAMTCNRVPAFDPETGTPTGQVDGNGNLVTVTEPVLPWIGNSTGNGTATWPGGFDFLVEPGTDMFVDRQGHPNAFYNFAPTNYYQRSDERITAGVMGRYSYDDAAELYLELNFMNDQSTAQLAPSGSFGTVNGIYCGNPLLSPQQFNLLCERYNLSSTDFQENVFVGRRNAEGGSRRAEFEHTQYRGVLGVRGDLGTDWNYDAYLNYAEVRYTGNFDEDLSISRMSRAVDVVADPTSGDPVCRSVLDGTDPDCVPWNVFASGAVTQAALDYITQPLTSDGSTRQVQVNGYVSGDLAAYGVRMPGTDEAVRAVLGFEFRDERIDYNPDPAALTGDVGGAGSTESPISGGYSVKEIFAEASVPLLEGKSAAELVSIDVAYRYSDYSTGKATNTYKFAGEWMFVPGFRLRASFQHAVRVGNINELFRPPQQGTGFGADSCTGQNPVSTLEECRNTGLSAAQYGTLPMIEDGFLTTFGGNPELDPEASDTVSFGFIINPDFLPEFSLSADYFDIEIEDAIAQPDPQFIFDQCLQTGEGRFCDAVNRDPATGQLSIGNGFIDIRNTNIGSLRTSGIDIVADYVLPIGRFGDLDFGLIGTFLDSWEWQELPGQVPYECAGAYENGPCARPRPELTMNLRSTWVTPWDFSVSLLWRYISDLKDNSGFDNDLPSTDYLDIAGIWDITEKLTLRFGVNNVLDDDPPFTTCCSGRSVSGNTIPTVYDALGRYWFAGVRLALF